MKLAASKVDVRGDGLEVGFGDTVPDVLVVLEAAVLVITVVLGDIVLTGCDVVVLVMLPAAAVVFEMIGAMLVVGISEHVRFSVQPPFVVFVQ